MTTTTSHAKPILVGAALLAFFTLFTLAIAGLHSQGAHPLPKAQPTTTQPAPAAPDIQGYLQALTNNGVASWLSDGEATHNGAGGFLACGHLHSGSTALQEVNVVEGVGSDSPLSHHDAIAVVDDAIAFLCPDVHDSVPMPDQG